MLRRLLGWWQQPDQFEWVTTFLRQRDLQRPTRVTMALIACSSAMAPITVLSESDTLGTASLAIGVSGAAFCIVMTWFWLTHWPTRRQSATFGLAGSVCVALWSVAQPEAELAALGCTALVVTVGYLAFFHTARLLMINLAIAFAAACAAVVRLVAETSLATAVTAFWLIALVNTAGPVTLRGTSRAMAQYARRSSLDPLTGLLNRRGFVEAVEAQWAGTRLTLLMVDLDDFKSVNDTLGHAAGDRVLRDVAELMRRHLPPTAAICRAGGEEFAVALPDTTTDVSDLAARLCDAVSGLPHAVSASIGVAAGTGPVEALIALADDAMYAAKRNGGNQIAHA